MYLKEVVTRARYVATLPSSMVRSNLTTSATLISSSDFAAASIAFLAASSQEIVLTPTSSIILYVFLGTGFPLSFIISDYVNSKRFIAEKPDFMKKASTLPTNPECHLLVLSLITN